MSVKQRLIEGILVGVVGGLVASAIGGIGYLAYDEMRSSREQLSETTDVAKQLNETSITSIGRMDALDRKLDLISESISKIEEENAILLTVNKSNSEAIGLIYESMEDAVGSDNASDGTVTLPNIKRIEGLAVIPTQELEKLPKINEEKEQIWVQQQQQQLQLEVYRNTQQLQQQQQQQQQQAW